MDILIEVLISILLATIYFIGHLKIQNQRFKVLFWCALLIILFISGIILHEEQQEISKIGSGFLASSVYWFLLPGFSSIDKHIKRKTLRYILLFLGLIILPLISVLVCFFILMFTGQIWGV